MFFIIDSMVGADGTDVGITCRPDEDALSPTAFTAIIYILLLTPSVNPVIVNAFVFCTGLNGVKLIPSIEYL